MKTALQRFREKNRSLTEQAEKLLQKAEREILLSDEAITNAHPLGEHTIKAFKVIDVLVPGTLKFFLRELGEDQDLLKLIEYSLERMSHHSPENYEHTLKVAALTMQLANKALDEKHPKAAETVGTDRQKAELIAATLLHDLGKNYVPGKVLHKSHIIPPNEFEKIKGRLGGMIRRMYAGEERKATRNRMRAEVAHINDTNLPYYDYGRDAMIDTHLELLLVSVQDHKEGKDSRKGGANKNARKSLTDNDLKKIIQLVSSHKASPFYKYEREQMQLHVLFSMMQLEQLPESGEFAASHKNITKIAGAHHETNDGKGYPFGLKKEEIPFPAMIMQLADRSEAMLAKNRSYRRGSMKFHEISRILNDNEIRGKQIDGELARYMTETIIPSYYTAEKEIDRVAHCPRKHKTVVERVREGREKDHLRLKTL